MKPDPVTATRPFRWSWRLGAPFGIAVYLHATFLVLVAWVLVGQLAAGVGAAVALESVAFLLAVFVIVVAHELGHALAALRFGIRTRAITLLPIGGVATLERMPERPAQELLVALAGPAVNIGLAAVLAAVVIGLGQPLDAAVLGAGSGHILARLFWVNVSLAAFNLLPAFPMDGGRVLRALLAMRLGAARATVAAAHVGKIVALGFGVLGLWANPMLVLIAVFVWLGADAELQGARVRSALAGIPVGRAMITEITTLSPAQPLRHAANLIVAGYAHDFPVIEHGLIRGLLTHGDVVRGLAEAGPEAPVEVAMHRNVGSVSAAAPLDRAFTRLQSDEAGVLIVTDRADAVGMLSLASLAEFLALETAIDRGLHPVQT